MRMLSGKRRKGCRSNGCGTLFVSCVICMVSRLVPMRWRIICVEGVKEHFMAAAGKKLRGWLQSLGL
jgi:hypothetical protein